MRSEWWQTALLVAVLVAAGGLAWSLHLRAALEVDPTPLTRLPAQIDGWRAHDVPLEQNVERMLQADFNLQRAYVHALGDVVWLYVGYYGTHRGGHPEHTPWVCYPSAGWEIVQSERTEIDRERGLSANELVVERDGERRLVLFWYHSYRDTGLLTGFDQAWDRLVGRLLEGRADGALVRISTPLEHADARLAARARLLRFGRLIDPLISAHWPRELPRGSEPPPPPV